MRHSFIDKYSDLPSFIHRIDPRIKIVTFFVFILFVIFTKPISFFTFALYGALIFFLILLSKVPLCFVFKRSLVIIPFVLMIAIFIPFLKRGEVQGGYSLGTLKLTVTYGGLVIFWNVLVKSYLSILCMILLSTTTGFPILLKGIEKLRCPKIITMILAFMYRYIYVLGDELMRMKRAKDSRTVGGRKWLHIKALANMIGVLFMRAYERGEGVYLAMCSRGFDGQIRTFDQPRLVKRDVYFGLSVIMLLAFIRAFGG